MFGMDFISYLIGILLTVTGLASTAPAEPAPTPPTSQHAAPSADTDPQPDPPSDEPVDDEGAAPDSEAAHSGARLDEVGTTEELCLTQGICNGDTEQDSDVTDELP